MNKIKEFRKKKNLSQSDISKMLGIKQNTFSQWENEIRIPIEVNYKIFDISHFNFGYLILERTKKKSYL